MRDENPWQYVSFCRSKYAIKGGQAQVKKGWTQPNPKGLAHVSKPNPKNSNKGKGLEKQPPSCSSLTKVQLEPLQENQVLENELGAIPSTFCHPLPDMNSA